MCDAAVEKRLAERLADQLASLKGESPHFERMIELEDTSSTKFHLCLVIYLVLPVVTICRLMWKLIKKAYLEYWVLGKHLIHLSMYREVLRTLQTLICELQAFIFVFSPLLQAAPSA